MIKKAAIDLIKEFEGFRAKAYLDPVGILTIGYGTTAAAGVGIIPRLGMTITEAEAERYLMAAVDKFAAQIAPKITAPINENEFGAFVSLAYNIGPSAFGKSSALRKFNAGDKSGAASAFLLWNKAGGKVMQGLIRRRNAERALFMRPVNRGTSTTTPLLDAYSTPTRQGVEPPSTPPKQSSFWARIIAALIKGFRP